jgi:hypothetical protein
LARCRGTPAASRGARQQVQQRADRVSLTRGGHSLLQSRRASRCRSIREQCRVSNQLAHELIAQLRLESIRFFHYQVKDAIPTGERWLEKLEHEIEQAGIFVALVTPQFLQSPWCLYELQVARKRAVDGRIRILPYLLDRDVFPLLGPLGLGEFQARDCAQLDRDVVVAEIVGDLDRELRTGPATPPAVATPAAAPAELVLSEDERRQLVAVLSARLTPEDGSARPAWVKGLLMRALLYARLAGEDYAGSAQAVATNLVTRAEALGVLPDGDRAITRLVQALRDEGRVTQSAVPFLSALADRLRPPAGS